MPTMLNVRCSKQASLDRTVEDLDVYNAQCQKLKASLDRIVEELDVCNAQCQMLKASLARIVEDPDAYKVKGTTVC